MHRNNSIKDENDLFNLFSCLISYFSYLSNVGPCFNGFSFFIKCQIKKQKKLLCNSTLHGPSMTMNKDL